VAWLLGPIDATVVYCTLFLPFGCGARLLRARRGLWRVPRSAGTTAAALRSPA